MTVKLGSNIASLQAQRRLGEATSTLGSIFERLSSGQRINSASDDAAGLAIAESLNARARVYTQGVRNGNDGLSVLAIADGALDTLTGVVSRLTELATQAANGVYSLQQRKALDAEAQALKKEYLRVAQTTAFNGIQLFSGALGSGLRLQLGYGVDGSINTSVGGAIGTGGFNPRSTVATGIAPQSVTLGDLNGDGILDMVTADSTGGTASIMLGNGDGTFRNRTTVQTSGLPSSITLGDLNGDGVLDIITADSGNTASIFLGNGDGTFRARTTAQTGASPVSLSVGDLNGDGILDIVTADNGSNTVSILLGQGNGTFRARTTVSTGAFPGSVTLGDLNGDGVLDIVTADFEGDSGSVFLGNGNGTFKVGLEIATGNRPSSLTLGDLNGDGILDIVTTSFDDARVSILLGRGDGTFSARTTIQAFAQFPTLGDLNGDGILDLVTTDGGTAAGIRLGNGNGTFGALTTVQTGASPFSVKLGDLNGDGVLDIITADFGSNGASILLAQTQSGLGALLDFSLKSQADALQALGMLNRTLTNLSAQRGIIGSFQSRVGVGLSNLLSGVENFRAAESRIRDTDIAADSAALIRTQILQQAGVSILAQANQQPALAVQLLAGR